MHPLSKFRYCPVCGSPRFEEHDFKSKRCGECGFTYYYNAAAAVIAVIRNERGEWLVARRGEEPARGTLDLIGGFVDAGETAEQAVRREIEEETGLHLGEDARMEMLFTLPNTYLYSDFVVQTCDTFFLIEVPSTTPLQAHDDVADCWWMAEGDLRIEDFGLQSVRNGLKRLLHGEVSPEREVRGD